MFNIVRALSLSLNHLKESFELPSLRIIALFSKNNLLARLQERYRISKQIALDRIFFSEYLKLSQRNSAKIVQVNLCGFIPIICDI